mgnify:CR=1 FL=1
MKLCIFEDEKAVDFFPLTMTRAVFELRCGKRTLMERLIEAFSRESQVCLSARDYLTGVLRERYPSHLVNTLGPHDDVLFVNGRWLYKGDEVDLKDEYAGVNKGRVVLIKAKKETIKKLGDLPVPELVKKLSEELGRDEVEAELAEWPWDLVFANPEMIKYDFARIGKRGIHGKVHGNIEIVGDRDLVYVAPTAKVYPHVVIDTEGGPVIIDEGAIVYPFSFIQGPSSVGEGTYIMTGAKVREGFTAGPVCRVGGEVEESIIHGYSNKYHDGFLGHAYVGEWVNLGALTTNSDLKNDYSEVVVYINGKPVRTGSTKVGSIIGDHTKTSIGTLLNTGAVIGVMCNVLSTDLSPKYIPSFTWYINGKLSKGAGLRRMLKTAETMMSRRGKTLTPEQVRLFEHLYEMTREEREYYINLFYRKSGALME